MEGPSFNSCAAVVLSFLPRQGKEGCCGEMRGPLGAPAMPCSWDPREKNHEPTFLLVHNLLFL